MEFVSHDEIKLNKVLTALDEFVLDFLKVLEKHSKYVIVSGYVSILFGRARATEDIDMFVGKLNQTKFKELYKDLMNSGYQSLNSTGAREAFNLLSEGSAARFSKKNTIIPNIEMKFPKNDIERMIIDKNVRVIIQGKEIRISPLELQIAFKEIVLKSDKDLEDARHLETIFRENLNQKKLKRYREMLLDDII